jgi:hypothetical protein
MKYMERYWYKILPQTPILGVDYSLLMVESVAGVLVKEETAAKAIPTAAP